MLYDLLIAIILIVAFFMCIIAFFWGVKVGKAVRNDSTPSINLNPVKAVKQHKEAKAEKEQQDLISEGLNNIFAYDGTPQVKEGD